jgi:hypothetical protein
MPSTLGGYTLTETKPYGDAALGTAYRFAGPAHERVTVFVFPIGADVRVGNDLQAQVTAEGKKFEGIFPIGVQRGWYQSYRFAFANPEPITVDGGSVQVEIQYLYAVCGKFLKLRATLDGETWTESEFPTFAKALAAQLAGH